MLKDFCVKRVCGVLGLIAPDFGHSKADPNQLARLIPIAISQSFGIAKGAQAPLYLSGFAT
jgi:hypothetical protein